MTAIFTICDASGIRNIELNETDKKQLQWWRQLWNIQGFYDPAMRPHLQVFLAKLFSVVSPTGLNFEIELANEMFMGPQENYVLDNRFQYIVWLSNYLQNVHHIPKSRLVYSGTPWNRLFPTGRAVLTDFFGTYSPHSIVTPGEFNAADSDIGNYGGGIIWSGDGGDGTCQVNHHLSFRNCVSVADAKTIARKLRPGQRYEYWDQSSNDNRHQWTEPLKEMAKIFGPNADKILGIGRPGWIGAEGDPEIAIAAYRKAVPLPAPPPEPTPIPPPTPPPTPTPPAEQTWWQKFLDWLKDLFN